MALVPGFEMGRSKGMLDSKLTKHSDTKAVPPEFESQLCHLIAA